MLSAVISSELSYPAIRLASQPVHQRNVHSGPLVLGAAPFKFPAPTADRDQTVSRRFKPSSRTSLNGEQPYPWDRLQPQDEMSRHRGAKHRRRYELLGGISLLSPEYLLSVERWPFHTEPPDHFVLPSYSSVTLWEETAPVKLPTIHCPQPGSRAKVRTSNTPGWYFNVGSIETSVPTSKPPTYPTQICSKSNVKLQ